MGFYSFNLYEHFLFFLVTVDGNFTNWGPWGPCSSSCGPGIQVRYRNCTNPPPINNGSDCVGPRNDTQVCNLGACPGNSKVFSDFLSLV